MIPCGASSAPRAVDQACRKAFEPEYVASKAVGYVPPKEPMVRIRPLLRVIIPAAMGWVMRRVERQFMFIMFVSSCVGVWVKGTGML